MNKDFKNTSNATGSNKSKKKQTDENPNKIALTFDLERDCPPYLSSTKNIKKGLPLILELLEKHNISSTFFVTGNIAEQYPKVIKQLSKNHELGVHGYHHELFNVITVKKKNAIKESKDLLEKVSGTEVQGFRAPNLKICNALYNILEELSFSYDSSIGTFMSSHKNINVTNLVEFKLEIPNVILRFPGGLRKFKKVCQISDFPVLFFHPWEALDMRKLLPHSVMNYYMRPDNWYHTGDRFVRRLEELIDYLEVEGFDFVMLRDML